MSMRAGSYGWDKPKPGARVFDPARPLYVHKASNGGGMAVGDVFVQRGHVLPQALVAQLGPQYVKLLHFVRELDHSPIPGLTPADQMPAQIAMRAAPGDVIATPVEPRRREHRR